MGDQDNDVDDVSPSSLFVDDGVDDRRFEFDPLRQQKPLELLSRRPQEEKLSSSRGLIVMSGADDDDDDGENAKDGVISAVKSHKTRMPIGIKVSRFLLRRLALPFRWSRSTSSDGRDVGQEGSFVMGNVGSIGEEGQQFMTLLID
mmetsp:Transcript_1759/g.3957  ORF Transcript_1759/g.3957 Transcript_1759/m.3957 type:complete len:146 (-) Transcript_1759:226-663(-)